MKTNCKYIIKRGKWYHFQKRPPSEYGDVFSNKYIQIPLNTDSESIAQIRVQAILEVLQDYFSDLAQNGEDKELIRFKKSIKRLKMMGFKYKPYTEIIADLQSHEFINRINSAISTNNSQTKKDVLGITKRPEIKISDIESILFDHEKLNLSKKTKDEVRIWKNPIKKAIKNSIIAFGEDKPIINISRIDILSFRNWWIDKIIEEGLTANSANKDLTHFKKAIRTAGDINSLDLRINDLFSGVPLKQEIKKERPPFETEYIKNTLLNHHYKNTNPESRLLIFAMADTGCRIKELVGLEKEDIVLDSDIPHIYIRPNKIRQLKTQPSKRIIPLVGSSLYAFKELPNGFDKYRGNSNGISATTNKYLRENLLLPTENHTLYSLRHSFEDRLTAVEPPEKLQAILMGHKYNREKYGSGPSLQQKNHGLIR